MQKILIIPSWYPNCINTLNGIFIKEQVELISGYYDLSVLSINIISLKMIAERIAKLASSLDQSTVTKNYFLQESYLFIPIYRCFKLTYFLYLEKLERHFTNLLNQWGKPDLIHAHVVLPAGWAASKLGKKFNIPVILTEHSGPFSMHLQTDYQRQLVNYTFDNVAKILAVSPSLATQIKRLVNNNLTIEVTGNLIKTNFFLPTKQNYNNERLIFLCVCFLVRGKGIDYLLDSIRILSIKYSKKFTVLIGGDGPEKDNLTQKAKILGIENNCCFLGQLSRHQVYDYMNQCDVFVLPSLGETFGVVIGEAMSCGKPVISTYCGGPEFIINKSNGLLVTPADSISLANAMESFINHQITFEPEVIRRSIQSRFGEAAFLDKLSTIYSSLKKDST